MGVDLPRGDEFLELGPKDRALGGGELLRVVDPAGPADRPAALEEFLRHEHGRRHHRPGQRPAPGLVHAEQAAEAEDLLEIESAQLASLGHASGSG